nr:unnamed protein product [Spirometra erinaceieuropaei]
MGPFSAACENFGHVIYTENTVVMHQPSPNTVHNASKISVTEPNCKRSTTSRIKGGGLADIAVLSGDLDCVQEAGAKNKLFPPQLSSSHTKVERQDRIPDKDVLESIGIISIYAMFRQLQLRWGGHLVPMDDKRRPKGLFYGDVATGSHRQGSQVRRYKDSPKTSLKRLQINPANWEDVAWDRPTWRKAVKIDVAIYEANRISAASANRKHAHLSFVHLTVPKNNRLQSVHGHSGSQLELLDTFGSIGPFGLYQPSSLHPPPPTPSTYSDRPPEPPLSSFLSSSLSPNASTSAVVAAAMHINTTCNPDTPTNTNATIVGTKGEDQDYTCPQCDHTFTTHIGLVGHLQIILTETGEPVPEAPTYTPTPASTVHTALAHSRIAWAYSATRVSTRAELTADPTHPAHL